MKKVNMLWLLGLLSVMVFCLSACSDDDDQVGSSENIVGTWVLVSNEGWVKENGKIVEEWNTKVDDLLYYVFHSDGTLEYIDPSDDYEVVETGSWKYDNGKLYLQANGEAVVVTVMSVSGTELVVGIHEKEVEDGVSYEYYEAEHYRKISDAA